MRKELGIAILLALLCTAVAIMNPRFLGAANLQNMARLIGMYGIFSIGLGLVIITGGIDLSVGSVFALQGIVLAMALREWHWHWALAVPATIAGAMVLGWFHGTMVARVRMQPFLVTLCGLLFYRGIARFIAEDETKGFGNEGFGMLRQLATGDVLGVPMPFVVLLGVAGVLHVVLHRSIFGRYLYAVGRNEEAARYSGIDSRTVVVSAYVVSMGLTGVSGVLIAFYTNSISPANHGSFYELYGIAGASEPGQPPGHPQRAELLRHGCGDLPRCARRPGPEPPTAATPGPGVRGPRRLIPARSPQPAIPRPAWPTPCGQR
jgi:ribose transport system permease protein